jgi:hypothetical protein
MMTFIEAPGANRRGFTFSGVGFPRFQEWSVERRFYLNWLKRVNTIFHFPDVGCDANEQLAPEMTRDEPLKSIG